MTKTWLDSLGIEAISAPKVPKGIFIMPSKKFGTTSVFRHLGMPNDDLWKVGRDEVEEVGHQLKGVAMVKTVDVRGLHLEVSSCEPPEKHADIGGWPQEPTVADAKAAQKEIAMRLASLASFYPSLY